MGFLQEWWFFIVGSIVLLFLLFIVAGFFMAFGVILGINPSFFEKLTIGIWVIITGIWAFVKIKLKEKKIRKIVRKSKPRIIR